MSEKFEFWGIDGCKAGWFCIGLRENDGCYKYFVGGDIAEVYARLQEYGAKIALIDIPIGLSDDKCERKCDKKARDFVVNKKMKSSVFRAPCRQAVDAYRETQGDNNTKEKAGKIASVEITGGCLSQQTWGIVPKIAEVDFFLCKNLAARKLFREVHPEVCFCALKGAPLLYGKGGKDKIAGIKERKKVLREYIREFDLAEIQGELHGAGYTKTTKEKGVADDDILDAVAAAITAQRGYGCYKTLPKNPTKDSRDLPMRMIYWER